MDEGEEDDSSNLAIYQNFTPPQPEITNQPDEVTETVPDTDAAVGPEAFTKLSTDESSNLNYQNYYNTYVSHIIQRLNNANLHGSKDELMKKLNYMIHLF